MFHASSLIPHPFSYAELTCKTNFSLHEGASHAEELAEEAKRLGLYAVAATDTESLSGIARAHTVFKEAGVKFIVGVEVRPIDSKPVILWAPTKQAYSQLCRLLTRGRLRAEKGGCRLWFQDVADFSDGVLAGVPIARMYAPVDPAIEKELPKRHRNKGTEFAEERSSHTSPGRRGRSPLAAGGGPEIERPPNQAPTRLASSPPSPRGGGRAYTDEFRLHLSKPLDAYHEVFGDRCYALAALHHGPDDAALLEAMQRTAKEAGLPLAASNDVHYHIAERKPLQDVLTAIRLGCTVEELGERGFPNAERRLKSPQEMAALFASAPDALECTVEIADRCSFTLDELSYQYPRELCPPGLTPTQYLRKLTEQGAALRYPQGVPSKVRHLIERELKLIAELGYEAYFLTVWDLARFSRENGILYQGRGSAANSSVCFCLHVTAVDPERMDLLVERFISKERAEAPDIDIDFEHERRDEVLQYLYEKYGRDRAALTAIATSYQGRSAIRDVGKALGFSLDRVDALAKNAEHYGRANIPERCGEMGVTADQGVGGKFLELVHSLVGFPRHLSQHPGGMVISDVPLHDLVPIENARMDARTVIAWDKYDLDDLGILKVDCLGLGMLTAIRKAFDMLAEHFNKHCTLANIPPDDQLVYAMLKRGDSVGVFQVESRAQQSMLPRLRPCCFFDLVVQVAIVRPGPIQGQMVHPYLRRRDGKEPVEYPNEMVKNILDCTLGVPLFQEQVMKIAMDCGGFSAGEADQLRRAMAAWRKKGLIEQFRQRLQAGMRANGIPDEFAERLYSQIQGFAEYGFPMSHAASFANLVYVSSWIKCHYPEVFCASLLNAQPMGFYAPAQLVYDAKRHDVEVLPIDVNASDWDCTLERPSSVVRGPLQSNNIGNELKGIDPNDDEENPSPAAGGGGEERAGGGLEQSAQRSSPPPAAAATSPGGRGRCEFDLSSQSSKSVKKKYAVRLGFRLVRGLREADIKRMVEMRKLRPFQSVDELASRTGFDKPTLMILAGADAFRSLPRDRRGGWWEALAGKPDDDPLLQAVHDPQPLPEFDPLPEYEETHEDYSSFGLTLRSHPMQFLRPSLEEAGVSTTAKFMTTKAGERLTVAGLVLFRQRPETAKGIVFVTLEDETGTANLIVRPQVWEAHRRMARRAAALSASGWIERIEVGEGKERGSVVHLMVERLADLTPELAGLRSTSRDFR
jgi:error-prone DNA polymerase